MEVTVEQAWEKVYAKLTADQKKDRLDIKDRRWPAPKPQDEEKQNETCWLLSMLDTRYLDT